MRRCRRVKGALRPSQSPTSNRQRIREEMMAERNEEPPETPTGHHDDDRQTVAPEPSIETIIKRIRARSEGSSADAQNGRVSPPFARSKNLQTVGKPSFLPSQTVDPSVCYTKLLRNSDRRLGAKSLNGRENRAKRRFQRTMGSRTEPVVIPVSRACRPTASASDRPAIQSATKRCGLVSAKGRR